MAPRKSGFTAGKRAAANGKLLLARKIYRKESRRRRDEAGGLECPPAGWLSPKASALSGLETVAARSEQKHSGQIFANTEFRIN